MTITKEQAKEWAIEAGTGAIPITALDIKFAQLAYTAGAEAKLQSLLAGVEMPEPVISPFVIGPCVTVTQLQTAVAAAVAKKEAEIVTAKYNEDTWYGRFMEAAQKAHDLQREVAALTAENARLIDINRDSFSNINKITDMKNAEIAALTAERDALAKDAARYQWWVNTMTSENAMETISDVFAHLPHDTVPTKEQFSEVVDAAMKGQP